MSQQEGSGFESTTDEHLSVVVALHVLSTVQSYMGEVKWQPSKRHIVTDTNWVGWMYCELLIIK